MATEYPTGIIPVVSCVFGSVANHCSGSEGADNVTSPS